MSSRLLLTRAFDLRPLLDSFAILTHRYFAVPKSERLTSGEQSGEKVREQPVVFCQMSTDDGRTGRGRRPLGSAIVPRRWTSNPISNVDDYNDLNMQYEMASLG